MLLLIALTHQAYVLSARINAQAEADSRTAVWVDIARQWEEAATNYSHAAATFREAAVSCLAKNRDVWQPLLERKPFNAVTPAWLLPLGVVEQKP